MCENMSPSERAVRELIEKKLGLKWSVEDWVLSYDAELTAVTDSRMVELHGEEREIALKIRESYETAHAPKKEKVR